MLDWARPKRSWKWTLRVSSAKPKTNFEIKFLWARPILGVDFTCEFRYAQNKLWRKRFNVNRIDFQMKLFKLG